MITWRGRLGFPRLALRLAGLQVNSRLLAVARTDAQASPPGNYATLRAAPGGGARRLPGLQVNSRLPAVARTDAQASPPGNYATLRAAP
ncbi:hypothetical protein RVU15_004402, partial [Klebsiella oxytoca]|nr:hypothetical protein [Klebsiella oxytoca]ELM1668193.1 hypothetical protein [Klebsiella oxytoca]